MPEHNTAVEAPQAAAVVESAPEPAKSLAPAASASATGAAIASTSEPAAESVPLVASPTVPAAPFASSEKAFGPANPTATDSVAGQATQQDAKPGAEGDLTTEISTASLPATKTVSKSEATPETTKSSEPSKSERTTLRRRPVVARRFQSSRSAASTRSIKQNLGAAQPLYQWTSQSEFESPRTVRRRVTNRRIHPARQPVVKTTTLQATAASNSTASPPTQW